MLPFIEAVAEFAWWSHPGRFTDGAVENILLEIGRDLANAAGPSSSLPVPLPSISRTLHVASELYVQGGHSRVLAKWVQRDVSSLHQIVVTRQAADLPEFLLSIAAERQVNITTLDRDHDIIKRALQLRALSRGFSRIILHHHPDDPVPVIAFAVPGGCPVVMFNHAHFWFSLGSGVADMIINTMPYFRQLTTRYRYPVATDELEGPFGLETLNWTAIDKEKAKERLGMNSDLPVAIAIGFERYFAPSGDVDFFRTLDKLLIARGDLQVLIVGIDEQSALVPAYIRHSGRVKFVGTVPDPRPYYEAADLCLESFPMPSLGALTEAVAYGEAFPVPAFAEVEGPSRVNQQHISSIAMRPRSEMDYIDYVRQLLSGREATRQRAVELRRTLIEDDKRFGDQFPALYDRIAQLQHAPRALPTTACSMSPENLELASMTDPGRIGRAINLLPVRRALASHMCAVVLGLEAPRAAARAIIRRHAGPKIHRLLDLTRGIRRRH